MEYGVNLMNEQLKEQLEARAKVLIAEFEEQKRKIQFHSKCLNITIVVGFIMVCSGIIMAIVR